MWKHILVIGSIDEISTGFIERIEQFERGCLVHSPHTKFLPLVTDAHGTETKGRNTDARKRTEDAVTSKTGLWFRCWIESDGHAKT